MLYLKLALKVKLTAFNAFNFKYIVIEGKRLTIRHISCLFNGNVYYFCWFKDVMVVIKQLLDEVEHDIMNYQNRGLCYLPKTKAEADKTDTRF